MNPSGKTIFTADAIERDLPTRLVGQTCMLYDETASTNDILRPIMTDRQYDGLAVFANHQSAGKGRSGRTWVAPPNSGILCSVLLVFDGSLSQFVGPVNLAAAIGATSAVNHIFDLDAGIKWPNDVYIDHRKLGGILIEGSQTGPRTCAFVIGLGLNVTQKTDDFPAELAGRATSIAIEADRPTGDFERLALARQWLIELDTVRHWIIAGELDRLRTEWLNAVIDRDKLITVEHHNESFRGRIIDIDVHDHSLLVQHERGLIWHLQPHTSRLVL